MRRQRRWKCNELVMSELHYDSGDIIRAPKLNRQVTQLLTASDAVRPSAKAVRALVTASVLLMTSHKPSDAMMRNS